MSSYLESELYLILGRLLRSAREDAGLSLDEVSKQMSCTPMTVQRYEHASRRISVEAIRSLCDVYHIGAENLICRSIDIFRSQHGSASPSDQSLHELERQLLDGFRQLNEEGQREALVHMSFLNSRGEYKKRDEFGVLEEEA